MKRIRLMYVHRLPIHRSLYACASARCRAHKHLHAPQCTEKSKEASCSARCLSSHHTRTNSNISSSSVSTVHRQLQHISHATTGKQHHSSYTCLIARLTLVLPLPPHATSPSFLLLFSKTIGTRRTTVPTDVEKAGMQMQMEGTQESKCFGKYASCNGMQRQEKMDLLTWGRSICEHS